MVDVAIVSKVKVVSIAPQNVLVTQPLLHVVVAAVVLELPFPSQVLACPQAKFRDILKRRTLSEFSLGDRPPLAGRVTRRASDLLSLGDWCWLAGRGAPTGWATRSFWLVSKVNVVSVAPQNVFVAQPLLHVVVAAMVLELPFPSKMLVCPQAKFQELSGLRIEVIVGRIRIFTLGRSFTTDPDGEALLEEALEEENLEDANLVEVEVKAEP
ncbi:hypothetical protein LR48_Vigan10g242400 [Vigna angularis]|uniref:Uncharacterized protein n=1 Tax=Phaseolus angularis TaxID=3914 RepID=A0A0L9VNR9_PHAAN|nr:hypothetical protein LR48_Vigan10g242400 [Vigna angularis]